MKKSFFFISMLALWAMMGCQSKPTKTIENLKAAIKGETTASAKYKAFAEAARSEGYDTVAVLFEAASKAESIHAANHTKVLEELGEKMDEIKPEFEVKTTAENLQAAIDGETYEFTTMYPDFIKTATAEGVDKAVKSFNWANDTEKKHQAFYAKALETIKSGTESNLPNEYFVCPVCGNTYENGNVDKNCAFCATSSDKFIDIK